MVYALACVAGAVGALGGWLLTGLVIAIFAAAFGIPGFEGARQTFNLFGPVGGLAGLVLGVVLILRFKGGLRSAGAIARRGALMVLVIGASVAAIVSLGATTLDHLGLSSAPAAVSFEIRVPKQTVPDSTRTDAQVELLTDRNQAIAELAGHWKLSEDGRPVLRGSVPLTFSTTQRLVALNLPGQPTRLFRLRLVASPSQSGEFSPWHQVDFVDNGRDRPQRARPDEGFAIRYRVL